MKFSDKLSLTGKIDPPNFFKHFSDFWQGGFRRRQIRFFNEIFAKVHAKGGSALKMFSSDFSDSKRFKT